MTSRYIESKITGIAEDIVKIVYPNHCVVCSKILEEEDYVCPSCEGSLPYVAPETCLGCGKRIYATDGEYCQDCRKHIHNFDGGVAALEYDETIRNLVYDLKYKNKRRYADFFADCIVNRCREAIEDRHIDILVPVPMYSAKEKQRGYNQAELLAKALGVKLHIPCVNALYRNSKTHALKELSREERALAMRGSFSLVKPLSKGLTVGIVDDIYTTGATMDECAKVIKSGGASKVYSICACVGQGF